jgi:hypothetical protein
VQDVVQLAHRSHPTVVAPIRPAAYTFKSMPSEVQAATPARG